MRKGIVATIVIYSLVLYLGFILNTIVNALDIYNNESEYRTGLFFTYSVGFWLLGFHLNNKYKENVKYWKYVFVGFVISFLYQILINLSCIIFPQIQEYNIYNEITTDYLTLFNIDYIFLVFMTSVCSIVAIFRNYYKSSWKIFNYE